MFQLNNVIVRASGYAMLALVLACSADPSGGRRPADPSMAGGTGGAGPGHAGASGAIGEGGVSGDGAVAAGAGGGGGGGGGAGGGDDPLRVHVEDEAQLVVDVVTVACAGECVEVKAVARGGHPAYHFSWEDGSTSATRMLCPSADSTHEVTVTDTARDDEEFGHAMETARASVDARVLGCVPPVDAGAGDECDDDSDCGAGQSCFEGVCVGEGGLRFSLTWNEDTDFDLFVRMPDGTEISFIVPSAGGGMLDVDDCFGDCRVPGGPHVENIFFDDAPPRGTYTYWIANSGVVTPDDFRLEVSAAGMVQATQTGSIAAFAAESARYTFDY